VIGVLLVLANTLKIKNHLASNITVTTVTTVTSNGSNFTKPTDLNNTKPLNNNASLSNNSRK
jgi:hypothetical protein